ncbi:MAG: MarR family transcriptional regulator [Clostridiales bacterium 38-18]|nr:MAG: MarR family transcriptional regulator [Clostridiales bacterium 38-18]
MDSRREVLNHLLVELFNQILSIEEKALKIGDFSDLTLNELHVIDATGYDQTSPMTHIATKLGVTVGTLTIAMNNLVKKGYINRVRSDEDRRVVLITLTDKGRLAYRHHSQFHEDMINFTIDALDESEGDVLIKSLTKIINYFDQKYLG